MNNVRQSYIREKKTRLTPIQYKTICNCQLSQTRQISLSCDMQCLLILVPLGNCQLLLPSYQGKDIGAPCRREATWEIIQYHHLYNTIQQCFNKIAHGHPYLSFPPRRRPVYLSIFLSDCHYIISYLSVCLFVCLFFFEIVNLFVMFILFLWPSHTTRNNIIFLAHFFS